MIAGALRFLLIAAAAALAWTAPVGARQQVVPDDIASIEAEMTSYGAWLGRLQEIEAPLQRELAGLAASYGRARAEGGDNHAVATRFRVTVDRIVALADSTNTQLEALERPEFPVLDLPEDVRPATILRDMVQLNRRIRAVIDSFNALIDASLRGDPTAIESAANELLAGVGQLFESQILLARASLAATPRDESSWEIANCDLLYLRAAARLFAAFRPQSSTRVDEALTSDLLALAEELDANARRGETKIKAELADYAAAVADAEAGGDAGNLAISRRVVAVFSEIRGYFPLSRELAALLQAEAPNYRTRALTQADFTRIFGQLQAIRDRMEEIGRRGAAVMAGPR